MRTKSIFSVHDDSGARRSYEKRGHVDNNPHPRCDACRCSGAARAKDKQGTAWTEERQNKGLQLSGGERRSAGTKQIGQDESRKTFVSTDKDWRTLRLAWITKGVSLRVVQRSVFGKLEVVMGTRMRVEHDPTFGVARKMTAIQTGASQRLCRP